MTNSTQIPDLIRWHEWFCMNLKRQEVRQKKVSALCRAVADCYPEDRIPVLEDAIAYLRPGDPVPAFDGNIMAEASSWADWATIPERKAYCLACYTRLTAADQAAFIAYVQKRAVA